MGARARRVGAPARGRAELTDAELQAVYEAAWIEPDAKHSTHDAEVGALRSVADAAVARFADVAMLPPGQ